MADWSQYKASPSTDWSQFKEKPPAPTAADRVEQDVEGAKRTGLPEQFQEYNKGGKTPEQAGLSLVDRARTWRDAPTEVAKGVARTAVPIVGQMAGTATGVPGLGIAGSAAGGAGLEALWNATGAGEDNESLGQAAERGAIEGGKMGLFGAGAGTTGKILGRVGGFAGKTGEAVGRFAGETVGGGTAGALLEGRAPNRSDFLEMGALNAVAHGAGKVLPKSLPVQAEPGAKNALTDLGDKLQRSKNLSLRTEDTLRARQAMQAVDTKLGRAKNEAESLREAMLPPEQEGRSVAARAEAAKSAAEIERNKVMEPLEAERAASEASMSNLTETERVAAAKKATALAEKKQAAQAFKDKLNQEMEQAAPEVDAALREPTSVTFKNTSKETTSGKETVPAPAGQGREAAYNIPWNTFRPDTISAAGYHSNPKLAEITRRHFGNGVLQDIGSWSMKTVGRTMDAHLVQNGAEKSAQKGTAWAQDIAKLFTNDPKYSKYLTPDAVGDFQSVAAGTADETTTKRFVDTFTKTVNSKLTSPELKAAGQKYALADVEHAKARAAKLGSEEATDLSTSKSSAKNTEALLKVSPAQMEARRAGESLADYKSRVAKAEEQFGMTPESEAVQQYVKEKNAARQTVREKQEAQNQVMGTNPKQGRLSQMLGNYGTRFTLSHVGGDIGKSMRVPFGEPLGRIAGYAAAPITVEAVNNKLYDVGAALKAAGSAPPGIRAKLQTIDSLSKVKGPDAARVALYSLTKQSPALRAWLDAHRQER